MRVAVHDRYWSTMGGGEQVAGRIAQVLSAHAAVDLLTPEPLDRARLEERLSLDLARCHEVRIGPTESSVTEASRRYDLLVNCTFLSDAACAARAGLYYVHFPGTPPERAEQRRRRAVVGLNRAVRRPHLGWTDGFHPAEAGGGARWTNGAARLDVWIPGGGTLAFTADADPWPPGIRPHLRVKAGRRVVFDGEVPPGGARVEVAVADDGPDRPVPVVVASDHFLPVEALGVPDSRQLGVLVRDAALSGVGAGAAGRRPAWSFPPARLGFLDTYDLLAANSAFTAGWVERLWGRPSAVLPPAVHPRRAGDKGPVIVSVGRFFDAASGHSKKQLEMARAFRRLVEVEGLSGWELHLVGGCDPRYRDYAMAVRRELQGLPAEVHFNAPGADLEALLARASIYWHAGGLGEDLEAHPDRAEHFGIAVVEAMSAGAVPVVFAAAGPAEVVRPGRDGEHVASVEELARATAALARDEPRRARLAASARARAADFGEDAFARTLLGLLERTGLDVSGARP